MNKHVKQAIIETSNTPGENQIQTIFNYKTSKSNNINGSSLLDNTVENGSIRSQRPKQLKRSYLFDGTAYIAFTDLSGVTIINYEGTSTLSINGNNIEGTTGTAYEILLSDGTFLKCDEGDGTTSFDSSGNGNHGIITNATLINFHNTDLLLGSNYQNMVGYSEAQELVTNGTFDTNTVGWDPVTGGVLSVVGQELEVLNSIASAGKAQQTVATIPGVKYTISGTYYRGVTGFTARVIVLSESLTILADTGTSSTTPVQFSVSFVATTTTSFIRLQTNSTAIGDKTYYDNISLKYSTSYIPRDESNTTLDIFGNPLQYKGRVPLNGSLVNSNALSFNGINQYIQLPFSVNATGSYEIVTYIKKNNPAGGTSDVIFDGRDASGDGVTIYVALTTELITVAHNSTTISSVNSYNDGNEHKIVASWDGATVTLNIDDGAEIITASDATAISATANATIGARSHTSPGAFYDGSIFGVKVTTDGVLQSNYPISEGNGSTIYDVSGNGNHGTAVNSPTWTTQNVFHYNLENGFSNGVNMAKRSDNWNIWLTNIGVTVTKNVADNFGGNTAQRLTATLANSYMVMANDVEFEAGQDYTISCWIRRTVAGTDPSTFRILLNDGTTFINTFSSISNTNWTFYSVTGAAVNTTSTGVVQFGGASVFSTGEELEISHFQIEKASTATPYQPTTGTNNIGAKVPATTLGYIPNGLTNLVSNSVINGHNGAETQIDFNPNDEDILSQKSVPRNYKFGDTLPTSMSKIVNSDGERCFVVWSDRAPNSFSTEFSNEFA